VTDIWPNGRDQYAAWSKNTNHLAQLAQDASVPVSTQELFITSKAKLAPEILENLAAILFDNAIYDRTLDMLVTKNRGKTLSLGVLPPPFDPKTAPGFKAGTPPIPAPQPGAAAWAKAKVPSGRSGRLTLAHGPGSPPRAISAAPGRGRPTAKASPWPS
jgi:hypothetical protein